MSKHTITLGRALKIVKKIQGELSIAKVSFHGNRVREDMVQYATDSKASAQRYHELMDALINLRSVIYNTNGPVAKQLYTVSECKAAIAELSRLDTNAAPEEDTEILYEEGRAQHRKVKHQVRLFISAQEKADMLKALQERLEAADEILEAFNHKTLVEVELPDGLI